MMENKKSLYLSILSLNKVEFVPVLSASMFNQVDNESTSENQGVDG